MPFRFPLQTVYHLRQSLEHQHELRLRAANQQVAKVRHVMDQIDASLHQLETLSSHELGLGTTAAEVRFSLAKKDSLMTYRKDLERELERVKHLRDQQQRIFQLARRERETFEILRNAQLREFKREQSRREQVQLDEQYLLRRAFLRRGEKLPG